MHRCDMGAHTDKVAAGVDVHDAVEIVDIDVSDGGMGTVIDLRGDMNEYWHLQIEQEFQANSDRILLTPAALTA